MLDTGIQVAHKQTSIESGYNVFDEIAERLDSSVKHWNESSPTSCRDSFAVSLDPANKQRDDGCQGVIPLPSPVIPVPSSPVIQVA
ncbi:hypothetical protein [Wolbachia endosymbiont of Liriomyza huidobrensis]|uniref:hypothetical protein n=1 Tax=Wolbachia endosymbiont of Liriomyza huidobrensis TaxID=2867522 RepID=UPI0036F359BA